MKRFLFTTLTLLTAATCVLAQGSIASLKNSTPGASITIVGVVTNGSELGVIRYMQDTSAGIALYPGTGSVAFNVTRGDSIRVTGTVNPYNNLVELNPITAVTKLSSGHTTAPLLVTPNQLSSVNDAELIRINNVTFNNPGALIAAKASYGFTSGGQSGTIYINTGSALVGRTLPLSTIDLVGINSTYNTIFQVLPRDSNDFLFTSTLYFTTNLIQGATTTNSIALTWNTNKASSTGVLYGKTANLELGALYTHDSVSSHSFNLTGLSDGTPYYVKGFSISGTDTAYSGIQVFSTVSTSSGAIRVYFNQSVDNSVSTGVNAKYVAAIEDTMVAYINNATTSIDVLQYNNGSSKIVTALNNAYTRGVNIRYIYDSTTSNSSLGLLNHAIYKIAGNVGGIMHMKVLIIDAESASNAWVYTGSMNYTSQNMFNDFNNILFIQDQALARAYKLEFNQMWGDTGLVPNQVTKKFGNKKLNVTPHDFTIGGKHVELYFSPSDNTTAHIINTLNTANSDVEFALLEETRSDLSYTLGSLHLAGDSVSGMINDVTGTGNQYAYLLSKGVNVVAQCKSNYLLHHKYAIIDQSNTSSDPTVTTGSHNWTSAAETLNDENEIIIHDATIANLFFQEWTARFNSLTKPTAPPVAHSITANIPGNLTVVNLLGNATDPNCRQLSITITGGPSKGTARNNNDGTVTYTPTGSGVDTIYFNVCDPTGLCTADTAFLQLPTGIYETPNVVKALFMYPNPAKDLLNISLSAVVPANGNIIISDVTGRKLLEQAISLQQGNNNFPTDISKLSQGVYLVSIQVDGNTITQRFVRQ